MLRNLTDIQQIIIHCSDSSFGDVVTLDRWHRERGWQGCGYHHVITNGVTRQGMSYHEIFDGLIQDGRALNVIGSHCKDHNTHSIGICLIGLDTFTKKQMARLRWLVGLYVERFGLRVDDVVGHYELDSGKTCPNFDVADLREDLKKDKEEPCSKL